MKAWVIVVSLVATGIVGGWVGYWLGHAFGWTTNAEWPLTIGGGERAIALSIAVSFLSVMAGLGWLLALPLWRDRRLLATGIPARATILNVRRTGVSTGSLGGSRSQLMLDMTVHPAGAPDYEAHAMRLVSRADASAFTPGVEVAVRCDPAHPARVAVEGAVSRSAT